jgi:hypothetical protein
MPLTTPLPQDQPSHPLPPGARQPTPETNQARSSRRVNGSGARESEGGHQGTPGEDVSQGSLRHVDSPLVREAVLDRHGPDTRGRNIAEGVSKVSPQGISEQPGASAPETRL